MIPDYNQIDPLNDSKAVIESKIQAIKKAYNNGKVTEEEVEEVKSLLAKASAKLGYAFTW